MKKIILFLVFILTLINLFAGDNLNSGIELPDGFYTKIFGVWDEEPYKDIPGSERTFSWGIGEYLNSSSVQIDYDLYKRNRSLDFQGLILYEITSVQIIKNNIYKLELYNDYKDRIGTIIVHYIKDNCIWFETESQYKFSLGLIETPDIQYGEVAYYSGDVITGPENLYYRRSGPDM